MALNTFQFALLVIATLSIAAAGNVINDIHDVKADAINKPTKVIVGENISEKNAYRFFFTLNILGVFSGFLVSNLVGKPVFATLFIIISAPCKGQEMKTLDYPDSLIKKRRNAVIISESIATISSLALLNEVWYKNYNTGKFHFFDDGKEWMQVDKIGHAMTSYYAGIVGIEVLKWSGVKKNKATIWGGSLGLIYLTGVEFLDGYSDKWGFSGYDMLANTSGTALAITQNLIWDEQRIKLKF